MTSENLPSPDPNADRTPDRGREAVPEDRPLLNLGTARPQPSPEASAASAPEPAPPSASQPPSIDPRLSQFEFPTEAHPVPPYSAAPASTPATPTGPAPEPQFPPGPLDLQDLEIDPPSRPPASENGTPADPGADPPADDRQVPIGEFRYGTDTEGFPLEAAAFSIVQGQDYSSVTNKATSTMTADTLPNPETQMEEDPWADPVAAPAPSAPQAGLGSGVSEVGTGETDPPSPQSRAKDPWMDSSAPDQPEHSPQTGAGESLGPSPKATDPATATAETRLAGLQARKAQLEGEVADLEAELKLLQEELVEAKHALSTMIREASRELLERRQALKLSIDQLEQRQEKLQEEMKQNFAGASQELAVRVQSFKNFLVGSLQDLVVAADDLKLVPEAAEPIAASGPAQATTDPKATKDGQPARTPRFAEQSFAEEAQEIRQLLDQYRTSPDYYGPPWQLRRTFEPIHADRVSNWFFRQGGRGAIRSLGGRTQNILVASAVVSILNYFYGEQLSALILANNPERLGEWRRGLQDCLGIARSDFGPNRGIALFEDPYPLAQRADRILRSGNLPLIIIDESEAAIDLSVLQFPIWLAFALDPADRRGQSSPEYF